MYLALGYLPLFLIDGRIGRDKELEHIKRDYLLFKKFNGIIFLITIYTLLYFTFFKHNFI